MEAKELRIGNLVEYDNRIFEIDCVSKDLPFLNTQEFGVGVVDYNNIKPIPLTEEWLLKFGFILKDKVNGVYLIRIHERLEDYLYCSKRGVVALYSEIIKEKPKDFILNQNIKYIHQLQNLYFALTGKELEINTDEQK